MRGRDGGEGGEVAHLTTVAVHLTHHHSVLCVGQKRNQHRDDSTVQHHLYKTREGG